MIPKTIILNISKITRIITLTFFLFFASGWHSTIFGQIIDSCIILPSSPTENDSVYIHLFGKHLNTAYVITDINVSIIDFFITVEIQYYKGNGFWQELPYDTMLNIGKLPMQNYIVNSYTLVPEIYDSCSINFSVSLITDYDSTGLICVFPNPTKSDFFIKNQGKNQLAIENINIYNSIGYLQQSYYLVELKNNTFQIDISSYPNGLYIVEIYFKNDQLKYQKIIKF